MTQAQFLKLLSTLAVAATLVFCASAPHAARLEKQPVATSSAVAATPLTGLVRAAVAQIEIASRIVALYAMGALCGWAEHLWWRFAERSFKQAWWQRLQKALGLREGAGLCSQQPL